MRRFKLQIHTLAVPLFVSLAISGAFAQVGPNPGEIPRSTRSAAIPQVDVNQGASSQSIGEPSTSEFVRPAIDELLLSQAKASGITEPSTIARDVRSNESTLPIGSPDERTSLIGTRESDTDSPIMSQSDIQTILALLGVVLLILGLGQLYKKLARSQGGLVGQLGAGGTAPSGIIEVIGRYPISKGMTLVVLKFDRKILLLSHAQTRKGKWGSGASMQTLCELNDAEDVASILLKARSASGDSIAQSFEQTLREADSLTDEYLHEMDLGVSEVDPVRFPSHRTEPARTITSDDGDRAELWSSGQQSQAASGVLRRRLASMRREQHG